MERLPTSEDKPELDPHGIKETESSAEETSLKDLPPEKMSMAIGLIPIAIMSIISVMELMLR